MAAYCVAMIAAVYSAALAVAEIRGTAIAVRLDAGPGRPRAPEDEMRGRHQRRDRPQRGPPGASVVRAVCSRTPHDLPYAVALRRGAWRPDTAVPEPRLAPTPSTFLDRCPRLC